MDTQNAQHINCGNDFYPVFFDKLCEVLEKGHAAKVYIDCIGHTRNNMTQEAYKDKLTEKYGTSLIVEKSEGAFSYSYCYQLIPKDILANEN